MQDGSTIKFTAKALNDMTLSQFEAIKANIAAPTKWDDKVYDVSIYSDFGTLMLSGLPIIIGIEPDGYTHS